MESFDASPGAEGHGGFWILQGLAAYEWSRRLLRPQIRPFSCAQRTSGPNTAQTRIATQKIRVTEKHTRPLGSIIPVLPLSMIAPEFFAAPITPTRLRKSISFTPAAILAYALLLTLPANLVAQQAQNPSPMVEHTRQHPRLTQTTPPGLRYKLTLGTLFVPEKLKGKRHVNLLLFFHPVLASFRHRRHRRQEAPDHHPLRNLPRHLRQHDRDRRLSPPPVGPHTASRRSLGTHGYTDAQRNQVRQSSRRRLCRQLRARPHRPGAIPVRIPPLASQVTLQASADNSASMPASRAFCRCPGIISISTPDAAQPTAIAA